MIRVDSLHKLEEMEAAVRRVAPHHGAHVIAVSPLEDMLPEANRRCSHQALSFTISHEKLYGDLMAADARFAALLPCRVAAVRDGQRIVLETLSPNEFCVLLKRPDLEPLAARLQNMLRTLMEEVARAAAPAPSRHRLVGGSLGAREGQVSMRASIPQRIDSHGTKIEDLAGTGELDAPGG